MSCDTHNSQHNHPTEHHCDGHHCNHHDDHHNNHEHHCCDADCQHSHTIEFTKQEYDFLLNFNQHAYLPLAQFAMSSTKSSHLQSIALSPVYLTDGTESVMQVREFGEMLLDLEDAGVITLDFDQPIENYGYELYKNSIAFHALKELIQEGSQRQDFLFDQALVEMGRMALTEVGQQVIEQLANMQQSDSPQD